MTPVDAHVHVWTRDPAYPFAPETPTPPARSATVEELLEVMESNGVGRAVLVQPIQYRWDNRYLADALRRYPGQFAAVCRVDPGDPAAPHHLARWTEAGFHGVRISPAVDPSGNWFDGPLMDPLLEQAAALEVPLLVLTRVPRLPRLAALLDRHPGVDVCVDHMADVEPSDAEGVATLLGLARHPRVRVKISHGWSLSREGFPWRDTWGLVRRVRDAFGPERLMWCSDWPVSQDHASYVETLSWLRDSTGLFTSRELEGVLGGNALDWWSFGDRAGT
jgi:L-fuconolactonase